MSGAIGAFSREAFDLEPIKQTDIQRAGSGMVGAVVGAATRSLIDGTDFGDNIISALPDVIGATIGNVVAGELAVEQSNRLASADKASAEAMMAEILVVGKRMSEWEKLQYDLQNNAIARAIMGTAPRSRGPVPQSEPSGRSAVANAQAGIDRYRTQFPGRLEAMEAQSARMQAQNAANLGQFDRDTIQGVTLGPKIAAELALGNAALSLAGKGITAWRAGRAAERATIGGVGSNSGLYRVGPYNEIKGTVSGLDAHHVGQKVVMRKLIPGYDAGVAPAILISKVGHTIKGPNGIVSRSTNGLSTPRAVVARDITELRRVYPDIPNSQLQQLIQANKTAHPQSFMK